MRHSFLRQLLIASGTCLLSLSLMSSQASAQKPKPKAPTAKPTGKPAGKPAGKTGGDSIDLDEPAPGAPAGSTPKAADNGPAPVAGQMTEQAAQAKRLFDGEKWGDASLALYRVYKGETGDDEKFSGHQITFLPDQALPRSASGTNYFPSAFLRNTFR